MLALLIQLLQKINTIIQKFIGGFIDWLTYSESIPMVIQNSGLALLTVLIPLAIAVLDDTNRKRKNKKRLLGDLDLHVILDYVFQIPKLLLWIAFIFLPLLIWDVSISFPALRMLLLFFSFSGIYFLSTTIWRGYLWVKGRVWDFRFLYLESLKEYKDFENVWRSIWQTEIINREDINVPNPNDEQKFWDIFSKKLDDLLSNDEE